MHVTCRTPVIHLDLNNGWGGEVLSLVSSVTVLIFLSGNHNHTLEGVILSDWWPQCGEGFPPDFIAPSKRIWMPLQRLKRGGCSSVYVWSSGKRDKHSNARTAAESRRTSTEEAHVADVTLFSLQMTRIEPKHSHEFSNALSPVLNTLFFWILTCSPV
jgi:hypothetical protein